MIRQAHIILLTVLLILGSCSGKKDPQTIYAEQASGVVMILNQCYYTALLPGGNNIYFSGIDEQKGELANVAFNKQEVKPAAVFGTGFFVGKDGKILTNRHVVDPVVSKDQARQLVGQIIQKIEAYGRMLQYQLQQAYQQNEWQLNFADDPHQAQQLLAQQQQIEQQFNQAEQILQQLQSVNVSQIGIVPTSKISIAYNNSKVSGASDFLPCRVLKVSQQEAVDLALVQLQSGATPRKAHVFSIGNEGRHSIFGSRQHPLALDDQVYMIGYNHGPELAVTAQGIKAQFTQGNVSQEPTSDRVMYSIPALQGSSGSPVVNAWGQLVAVNFAGVGGSQGFNFGIPLKAVQDFLK